MQNNSNSFRICGRQSATRSGSVPPSTSVLSSHGNSIPTSEVCARPDKPKPYHTLDTYLPTLFYPVTSQIQNKGVNSLYVPQSE
jgi:hypothetical protein